MTSSIVDRKFIEEVAENTDFSQEEIDDAINKIQSALQQRLLDHYESCWLQGGLDYLVLESDDYIWFAFTLFDLNDELRRADMEIEYNLLVTVATIHLDDFQDTGLTITFSKQVGQRLKDPFFYPIRVRKPSYWDEGRKHVEQSFENYLFRYEMSPAEAVDYWAVNRRGKDVRDWAGTRRVDPEAVRKNVRQAREKMEDDDLGRNHPVNEIRTVRIEDIPDDGTYDPETERFYIPTEDHLEDDSFEQAID